MGTVTIPLPDQFASALVTIDDLKATSSDDIFPDFDTTVQVKAVDIDATANPGEDVYVKFYNLAAPTVGTDIAVMWLWGKAGAVTPYSFPEEGISFTLAPRKVSVACVKEAGGEEGTTSPSGQVDVKILGNGT